MIPKRIHYCWFGRGEKPKLAKKCIESWKRFCPDYEIIEWNEDNFDLNYNEYIKYCYENKKWAYLSDLVRLIVVKEHGGIYFDTDVEVISSFDGLLNNGAFFGFENCNAVNTGQGFAAEENHPMINAMIEQYDKIKRSENGEITLTGCPKLNTDALLPFGLKLNGNKQIIDDAVILPVEYMNPYDDPTGRLNKTENTLSIHWYSKSALSKSSIIKSNITRPFHRIFGTDCFEWVKKIIK